jgi:hypothetical protein
VTLALTLLSLLAPIAVGCLLVQWLWPALHPIRSHLALKIGLGAGCGLGLSSVIFFLWLVLFGPPDRGFVLLETALYLGLVEVLLLALRRRAATRYELVPLTTNAGKLQTVLAVVFLVGVAGKLLDFTLTSLLYPHGVGDAWFIWNMKARFLFRGGESWTNVFADLPWCPGDYPLLVPAGIARAWYVICQETKLVPALIALLFTFGTVGVLVTGLAALRNRSQGALAGLLLLGTFFYMYLGQVQVADVPLSFFFLATVVLFSLQDTFAPDNRRWLVLAGVTAGFAAWTKNEGVLFLVAVLLARLIVVTVSRGWRSYARELKPFLVGLLPMACLLLYYKTQWAPASYLFAGQDADTLFDRFGDVDRYRLIVASFARRILEIGAGTVHPLTAGQLFASGSGLVLLFPVYRLLLGKATGHVSRAALASTVLVLTLMLLGYMMVYVTTPLDVLGHLYSSLHRLLMHLWPLAVFVFFLGVATPEEALARRKRVPAESSPGVPAPEPAALECNV